jgi:hypothetical protein
MTTTEYRLQRLEALLERVRRRATEARRPLGRLLGAALSRSEPPAEPVSPPMVEPREPVTTRPEPNMAPFTVVPATLELVDTPPLEELGEEDFLDEIPPDLLDSVPPSGETVESSAQSIEEEELEPPVSSQRPRGSGVLDHALLDAASEPFLDDEREVPLKTPPPESGPQEAPMPSGFGAPPIPEDVEGMLEAELASPAALSDGGMGFESLEAPFGRSMPTPAASSGPTVEQLGQTIDLDEAAGPRLELDAPQTSAPPPSFKSEELEAPLPTRESAGRYHEELMPPPEAREDLDAHREKLGQLPSRDVPATDSARSAELAGAEVSAPVGPEVIGRPPLESGVVFTVRPSEPARPSTFLELLDSSIALGG